MMADLKERPIAEELAKPQAQLALLVCFSNTLNFSDIEGCSVELGEVILRSARDWKQRLSTM